MSAALGEQVKAFQVAPRRWANWWLQLDPLLLAAAIGLIAFGSYVVGTATKGDIPGSPDYYLYRQAGYGVVGLLLMLLLARIDYWRLPGWRLCMYGPPIALTP